MIYFKYIAQFLVHSKHSKYVWYWFLFSIILKIIRTNVFDMFHVPGTRLECGNIQEYVYGCPCQELVVKV